MTNSDKIISAFLVSLGLLSTAQANQYVSGLSTKDKKAIYFVAQADAGNTESAGPSRASINQDN